MTIDFYLNDEAETLINSLSVNSNPFEVGDEIGLSVAFFISKAKIDSNPDVAKRQLERQRSLEEKFNKKSIKIIKEEKYINNFNIFDPGNIKIEYHCEIID